MARLISYKVKDDSEYSTFIDKRDKPCEEVQGSSVDQKWQCWQFCRNCCCNDAESDEDEEVELALVKETKVANPKFLRFVL